MHEPDTQSKPRRSVSTRSVSTRRGYDLWAHFYDREDNPMVALDHAEFAPRVNSVDPVAQALELGCGTGRITQILAKRAQGVLAVDASAEMLKLAAKLDLGQQVEMLQVDLNADWKIASDRFELLVSALVLEHIADLRDFFAQAHMVARRGAEFLLSTMHPALFLRQVQAHFVDPDSGEEVQFESFPHQVTEIITAAIDSGWTLADANEVVVNEDHRSLSPRLEKFIGWPMLLSIRLSK